MFISIKTKTLIFQIGLILLVASLIGLSSYFFMLDSLRKSQEKSLEYIAQSQARQVASSLQSTASALQDIAQGYPIKTYFDSYKDLLVGYLDHFRQQFPILALVNESGREELKVSYGKRSNDLSDLSQTISFQEAIRNPHNVFISPSAQILSPTHGSRTIFLEFAFCLKNHFDEFVCLTIGRVPLPM